jgi:hypothetical protein
MKRRGVSCGVRTCCIGRFVVMLVGAAAYIIGEVAHAANGIDIGK